MSIDDIKTMTAEELDARFEEIRAAIDTKDESADFEAMSAELDAINERRAAIKTEREEAQRKADMQAVIAGAGKETEITMEENDKMGNEVRNSSAYINAFANYIKTGKDEECRALLTTNVATGTVPVPEFVYEIVKNAWETEGIMSRVSKSYLAGNLKVTFEVDGDEASVHTEGAAAPSQENLILGIVDLTPVSIKKWIKISDEVVDMGGEQFLRYIYDELTYRIAKKAADTLISKIIACGTVSTNTPTTNVAVGVVATSAISAGLIASAMAKLSDQAQDPVIIMNRQTWGAFKAVQAANGYNYDVFEGLPVLFNNSITAFSAATTGVTFAIVGDLGEGAKANFPNGEEITIKYDDLSEAEADLVKIVGREYVGLGVVGPDAFCKITIAE